jgi:AraC-like DNA-binding protein
MDPLSDVLRIVRLSGGVFLDARFTAPWSVITNVEPEKLKLPVSASTQIIAFHYVVAGALVGHVLGEPAKRFTAGSLLLFPRNDLHVLGSADGLRATSADDLVMTDSGQGLWELQHGGGGEATHIVCGFLGCSSTFAPMAQTLPAMLSINIAETSSGGWIAESFGFAMQRLADGGVGGAATVAKLSELMFVEALRHYIEGLAPEGVGWLSALRDPSIGRALGLMHAEPQRPWSAEELADAVRLSRSTFADRFTGLVGQPPMRYLSLWRMQLAARALCETDRTIAQISAEVGYESEVAFTRAFRRHFGHPPAAWRKQTSER